MRAALDGKPNKWTINHKQLYFFNIIDCGDSAWEAHLSYVLYSNNQMNQLSLDDMPLPMLYFGLTLIWFLLLLSWSIELFRFAANKSPLHYILLGVIILKEIVVCLIAYYWWMFSSTGYRFTIISTLQSFLFAFSETAFFAVLYLTSKGWRILRSGMPASEIRSTFIALFILVSTLLFFSFYNTEYYWLSLVLMYFFMLPKIFTSISQNIRTIDSHISTFTHRSQAVEGIQVYLSLLQVKRIMFVKIRTCLVVYLIAMLLVNSLVRILVTWDLLWISRLCDEAIVLIIVAYVAWNLRPALKIFFTSLEEMRPFLYVQGLLQGRQNEEDMEEGAEISHPWDLSKTLVIQWPVKIGKIQRNILRLPLALGHEEIYFRGQNEKSE
jgi:hypothetical protein